MIAAVISAFPALFAWWQVGPEMAALIFIAAFVGFIGMDQVFAGYASKLDLQVRLAVMQVGVPTCIGWALALALTS